MSLGHGLRVTRIVSEADGIYSVYVAGRKLERIKFEPGQYATWWVLAPGLWWQGHPFSFSGIPGAQTLRFTVKASGNYTAKLPAVALGARIIIDGPRGAFTADRATTNRAVLIGGGIGVAPLLVQAQALLVQGRHVTMLYASHDADQIAFSTELAQLQQQGLELKHFISTEGNRLTPDALKPHLASDTTVFICGPDRLTRPVKGYLARLGLPPTRIITEEFSY
jgi:ferredoxin-NADP reductase